MGESTVATFNAGASMLGYLYQVRVALLWAIRQSRIGDFSVSVETLDDVSFEANGDPIAVLQTKHSVNSTSGLSDLSPDLWKTLRVWMVGRISGEVPIVAAKFLISTSAISAGTACSALVPEAEGRDVEAASTRLKQAATTSTNAELKDAFEAFLALGEAERQQLLSSIYVVAASPMPTPSNRSCRLSCITCRFTTRRCRFR